MGASIAPTFEFANIFFFVGNHIKKQQKKVIKKMFFTCSNYNKTHSPHFKISSRKF